MFVCHCYDIRKWMLVSIKGIYYFVTMRYVQFVVCLKPNLLVFLNEVLFCSE